MADHRVTDLAIGHPGRATYDTEEQEWKFSQNLTEGASVKQLLPFKEWIPPSDQIPAKGEEKASLVTLNQTRWLSKTLPEAFPARSLAADLVRGSWEASPQVSNELGCLLAIGRAHDAERVSGVRRPQIIAVPCGAAGHVLRLIKPRIETRGWGKSSGARLSFLNLDSLDSGYWMGTGGTIRQIATPDGDEDRECWLAVRQATVITLFRPKYGKIHSSASTGNSTYFAPSLLNANPTVSLTAQRTGSKSHSDVSFNPWFSRQFAVIDTLGYWSIWEVDTRYNHGKNAAEVLIPKRTGGIYDGHGKDEISKSVFDHYDGWYRILWACNLSTIVTCNRRHVTVFDVKAQAIPLGQFKIFPTGNTDWILDVQRCTTNMNHLYVLTTSRIFWLEIISAGESNDEQTDAGGRIILSYFHFMSPDDETLRLAVINNDKVSVAITSGKNQLVNHYTFRKPQTQGHASSQGSFSLLPSPGIEQRIVPLHSVSFLPCRLLSSTNHFSGPGPKYIEAGLEFFQLLAITTDLGLVSTMAAIGGTGSQALDVKAPETKILMSSRHLGPKYANDDDDFVVPDDQGYSQISQTSKATRVGSGMAFLPDKDDLRFRLNWRRIFQKIFLEPPDETSSTDDLEMDTIQGLAELLSVAANHVVQRKEEEEPLNMTLAEIVGVTKQGEDLEEVSPNLRTFLESLDQDQTPEDRWKVIVKNLTLGTEVRFHENEEGSMHPELLSIFDQLVDCWMSSLPPNLPNLARHTKFKVIRQLALDLCLHSIGIFLQDRALNTIQETPPLDDETIAASVHSKDGRTTRESSPMLFSSQLVAMNDEPGQMLPTPNQTPSLYSQATSASGIPEDSAIARLRQYAPNIRAKPELSSNTNGSVLSHWPSALADPAEYSYESAKKAWAATNTEEADARSSRKEKARRRRRTEEFVKAVEPAVSRRLTLTSGSQPEVMGNMFSSQPVNEMPMTQPDRGTFGSRTAPQAKKKPKKQRTAGFK